MSMIGASPSPFNSAPPSPQHTLVSGPRARHANVVPKLQEAKHEEVFDIKEGYLVSDCNAWSGWQCA